MRNDIVGLAQQYAQEKAQTAAKRIAIPAAFGLVAAVFFLIVVIALFAALFYWLTSLYGPITAALLVAAVALVLGLIALLPLVVEPAASATATRAQSAPVRVAVGADCAGARAEAASLVRVPVGGRARDDGARLLAERNSAAELDADGAGRAITLASPARSNYTRIRSYCHRIAKG